jgi:hypothetical protein
MLVSNHQKVGKNCDKKQHRDHLNSVTMQLFGKDSNRIKFDLGENEEEIELW